MKERILVWWGDEETIRKLQAKQPFLLKSTNIATYLNMEL